MTHEKSIKELSLSERIGLELLWCFVSIFSILPRVVKYYVVEEIIFFIFYYILHYRQKVVDENLKNSFPEKSAKERAAIRRKFYYTLSEMFVNTLNMAHMPVIKALQVLKVENLDEHLDRIEGRDWIAMMAHYGCWEYGFYWSHYNRHHELVAVYHPLHSQVINQLYRRLRTFDGAMTVPMQEFMRFYLRHHEHGIDGKRMAIALIADQNPPKLPKSHWIKFLNQDTIFFDGGEKIALKCKMPIYFVWMDRTARGCYKIRFEQIYDGAEAVAENEITERYARKLEEMIRRRPELWMWSHRRWKHKRNDPES